MSILFYLYIYLVGLMQAYVIKFKASAYFIHLCAYLASLHHEQMGRFGARIRLFIRINIRLAKRVFIRIGGDGQKDVLYFDVQGALRRFIFLLFSRGFFCTF